MRAYFRALLALFACAFISSTAGAQQSIISGGGKQKIAYGNFTTNGGCFVAAGTPVNISTTCSSAGSGDMVLTFTGGFTLGSSGVCSVTARSTLGGAMLIVGGVVTGGGTTITIYGKDAAGVAQVVFGVYVICVAP